MRRGGAAPIGELVDKGRDGGAVTLTTDTIPAPFPPREADGPEGRGDGRGRGEGGVEMARVAICPDKGLTCGQRRSAGRDAWYDADICSL